MWGIDNMGSRVCSPKNSQGFDFRYCPEKNVEVTIRLGLIQ